MKPSAWLTTFIGIILLLAITLLLVIYRNTPTPISLQVQSPISITTITFPTAEALLPDLTLVPTNEPNNQAGLPIPTETTAPTLTPLPTATLRPGANATPFPTRAAEQNPGGQIFYTTLGQRDVYWISVNSEGQILEYAAKLPTLPISDLALVDASPGGKYLLLMQVTVGHAIPYIYNRLTGETKRVLREENSTIAQYFGWHPDSQQILFARDGKGIGIVHVETGQETMLGTMRDTAQGAAISPDGQSVIYVADSELANNAVWLAQTSGHGAEILFSEGGPSYIFDWSPLGDQLLSIGGSSPDVDPETSVGPLWLLNIESREQRPLNAPFITGFGLEPSWSPDGKWIAFAGLPDGKQYGCAKNEPAPEWPQCQFAGTILYIANPITGELRAVGNGIQPTWSPDGSMLAFIGYQNGTQDLWMVDVEGNRLQQLTHGANTIHAVWTTAIP